MTVIAAHTPGARTSTVPAPGINARSTAWCRTALQSVLPIRPGQVPAESGILRAQPVASMAEALPGLLIYRFTHSMYYAKAQQLSEEIMRLADGAQPPLRWFCIDASGVDDVDYSTIETLRSVFGLLQQREVRLVMAQLLDGVKSEISRDFRDLLGADAIYETLDDVLSAYRDQMDERPL